MILLWITAAVLIICFGLIVLRGAPYVPSHRRQLVAAFDELYPLGDKDMLVDLGSGDGVVLEMAARRGAGAIGYELNPILALWSRWRLRKHAKVQVRIGDFLSLDKLPGDTTVVYAFTTGHMIDGIGAKLTQWSAGRSLYLISYGFELRDSQPVRSVGPMHLYLFGLSPKA